MNRHATLLPIAATTLLLLASGCNTSRSTRGGGGGGGGSELVGAWYGSGADFPDGELCLVFCDNGRLFVGDSSCGMTDRSDFEHYFTYEAMGTHVEVTAGADSAFAIDANVSGNSAIFFLDGIGELPFMRAATSSPLCLSSTAQPYPCWPWDSELGCE